MPLKGPDTYIARINAAVLLYFFFFDLYLYLYPKIMVTQLVGYQTASRSFIILPLIIQGSIICFCIFNHRPRYAFTFFTTHTSPRSMVKGVGHPIVIRNTPHPPVPRLHGVANTVKMYRTTDGHIHFL